MMVDCCLSFWSCRNIGIDAGVGKGSGVEVVAKVRGVKTLTGVPLMFATVLIDWRRRAAMNCGALNRIC